MPMRFEKLPEETKQKSLRLNGSLITKIERMAQEENRTFNNMVETILIKAANASH